MKYFVRVDDPDGRVYVAPNIDSRKEFLGLVVDDKPVFRYITRLEVVKSRRMLFDGEEHRDEESEAICYGNRWYPDKLHERVEHEDE